MSIMNIIENFKSGCPCGRVHDTAIQDVRIGSGLVDSVGEILVENNFSKNLLLVCDRNTLKASEGIVDSLKGFSIEYKIFEDYRIAKMEQVVEIENLIRDRDIAVLSVGSGSINDICRLASARQDKRLCIFATAPSMDGFASYGAPIVHNGFKSTYSAKSPEVIIGDTKILANAPAYLKSAGFGDMISKYVALVDWQISTLLTGEYYCEQIASLTREAVDELFDMADKVTLNDEKTAGMIFESLLKTGIGMSFSQNSRPASGAEHIIAHIIDCLEIEQGLMPNYHGEDVGVCTLETLKYYNYLAKFEEISTKDEEVDWQEVYSFYGNMASEVKKLNEPDNIIDYVDKDVLKARWHDIVDIIKSVPTVAQCEDAMRRAGCKITIQDIGKDREFFDNCMKYSPYMRKRLTLLRLKDMIVV